MRYRSQGLGLVLSAGLVSNGWCIGASNIGDEVPSARAAGQGYVGVAGQNDDPTVVWSNPAAMTKLRDTRITLGAHWENIHGKYESSSGAETSERTTDVVVPNFSLTQGFMDGKLGAGLSVQSPYGLQTHWPNGSPMQYVATNSQLGLAIIAPAVAYQVSQMLSIGVGADYADLFDAQLDRQVNVDALNYGLGYPTSGSPDAVSSLRGQAKGWGYHAGLLFEPYEKHSLGITYHSKINLRINGNLALSGLSGASASVFGGADYSASVYTDLVLPSNVQFGYAFKPNSQWTLEADAAWYHWSELQDLNIRYPTASATQLAVLNTGNPASLALRDAWSFAAGANYKATDRWQFRGGFWYEPWAQPESTFNPAFLDLTRYGLTGGLGYQLTDNLLIDAAYEAVFMHNRVINNTVGETTTGNPAVNVSGLYKDFANLFALNFTYKFGKS